MGKRIFWDIEKIRSECDNLGITCLSENYNSKEKQNFRCSCGNLFKRKWSNVRLGQTRCLECSQRKLDEWNLSRKRETYESFVRYVSDNHEGFEVVGTIDDYVNNKTPIAVKCRCGNIFHPTANNMMRGKSSQCSKCSSGETGDMLRKPLHEIKDYVLGTGYHFLDYEHREGRHWFKTGCPNESHDSYWVDWGNYMSGNRCPTCNSSKGESAINAILSEKGFDFDREVKFDGLVGINGGSLRFDFCVNLEDEKILIEFDGEQHFKPKFGDYEFQRTVNNDKIKDSFCKEKDIRLVRIPYTEIEKIEDILKEELTMSTPR